MTRNVEIKARVVNLAALTARVEAIADDGPIVIEQEDTFFPSATGRLKLRKFSAAKGELIYYERPGRREPTECRYTRVETPAPDAVHDVLSRLLGVRGVVRKRRTLYLRGNTRIHLDDVEDLGHYVELEVVLSRGQTADEGTSVARDLMRRLGIAETDLVEESYIDLLERSGE
jgi:predicted adenylyl cyclase CyaB